MKKVKRLLPINKTTTPKLRRASEKEYDEYIMKKAKENENKHIKIEDFVSF